MAFLISCGCDCHAPRAEGEMCLGNPCEHCTALHAPDACNCDCHLVGVGLREPPHGPDEPCPNCSLAHPVRRPAVSPAILKPDPDPETPMTTTDITVHTVVEPETLVLDDRTIRPHTGLDVARLIRKANASPIARNFVQKARGGEGTGSLGLYIEAVQFTKTGLPFTHLKYFVVGTHLYAYSRNNGDSRANWQHRKGSSLQAVLNMVQSAINRTNVQVFGHPVLVELTVDDLSTIEEGGMPPARFRGQYRIEKDFGRYDFAMDVASSPLPAGLAALLAGFATATPEVTA